LLKAKVPAKKGGKWGKERGKGGEGGSCPGRTGEGTGCLGEEKRKRPSRILTKARKSMGLNHPVSTHSKRESNKRNKGS